MLGQLVGARANVIVVVVQNELKLLLDGINLALQLALAVVNFRPLVKVLFELLLSLADLSQFGHSFFELGQELVKLFLRLLNQVAEDLGDRDETLIHEICLELGGVEHNELFISGRGSIVTNFINNFLQGLDTVFVLVDGVVGSTTLRTLKETHLTTMGTQTGQVTDFVGNLPHLAIFLHLLLDGVNNGHNMVLDLNSVLSCANLVIVVVVATL